MEKVISVEIPAQWLQGLDWDQRTVVQEIIQLGTRQSLEFAKNTEM